MRKEWTQEKSPQIICFLYALIEANVCKFLYRK